MINLNRHGESITGSINGKPFGVNYSEEKWDAMVALQQTALAANSVEELAPIAEAFEKLTVDNYNEMVQTKCKDIYISPASGKFFLKHGDFISTRPIPKAFAQRILDSIDLGIDPQPLIKAWARFLRNPRFSADFANKFVNYLMKTYTDPAMVAKYVKEQGLAPDLAAERATVTQTPVTLEGLICTYKVSTEQDYKWALDKDGNKIQVKNKGAAKIDENSGLVTYDDLAIEDRIFKPCVMADRGDAFWCGDYKGHVIKVGKVHKLDSWDQVKHCGGPGLHCGNLDYIRSYQSEGTVTHETFIDPMHIGDFSGSGDGALVTLQYFTHRSFGGVCRTIYHSSEYAKLTDAEWADVKAKAVAAAHVDIDAQGKYIDELAAL